MLTKKINFTYIVYVIMVEMYIKVFSIVIFFYDELEWLKKYFGGPGRYLKITPISFMKQPRVH